MKVLSVKPAKAEIMYDLKVPGTHSALTSTGVVVHNCDTRCLGKTCGVCDKDDLKLRRNYIQTRLTKADIDLSSVKIVDQKTVAMRLRIRVNKPERYRFIMNDHWRFNVRRAAYKATHALGFEWGVAKRTIKFSSDDARFRDWTCGTDYLEFGITKIVSTSEIQRWIDEMNRQLCATYGDPSTQWIELCEWKLHPPTGKAMKTDIDLSLWELEIDEDPATVLVKLRDWHATDYVKMILRAEGGYFAPPNEVVNAKDYVEDMWLARDGAKVVLKMLLRGRPSPYNLFAALMGRTSWLDAASRAAVRIDAFMDVPATQYDFFRKACERCQLMIPINVFDEPFDPVFCPHCRDGVDGSELMLEVAR